MPKLCLTGTGQRSAEAAQHEKLVVDLHARMRRQAHRFPVGRSEEHRRAFAQLRTLAGPFRFRVLADAEGFPVIPGRSGQIEWYNPEGRELAVYTERPRLFARLWAIPGVRRHQTGDRELRALFPPEALEQVAGMIQARRRRTLSPDTARRLGATTAYSATSGPQNLAGVGSEG